MKVKNTIIVKENEFCNHCGNDVSFGSGRFVNRIPDLNEVTVRIMNNLKFPLGDFVCHKCDEETEENYE